MQVYYISGMCVFTYKYLMKWQLFNICQERIYQKFVLWCKVKIRANFVICV